MQVLTLESGPDAEKDFLGTVLCQIVTRSPSGRSIALRKGQIIRDGDLAVLRSIERQSVRVIRLEDGDVHEDDAGRRLAMALAGPGLALQGPTQSRMNVVATTRGIAVINTSALFDVNLVPDVSIFTVLPNQPVGVGDVIAGAKVIPVVARESAVGQVERIAREHWPILQVKPFLPLVVGVISKQRPDPKLRDRFESILQRKLAWFGASLLAPRYVTADVAAARQAFIDMILDGADLILTAGSSSSDPLDSLVASIQELGGTMEVHGTPTHPGSFFWLAYLADRPVFGMPSCGAYSAATVVDLLLLRVMAGLKPRRPDIAELGAGGLFGRGSEALFPTYDGAKDDLASTEPIGPRPG
jgi:hypothetical protein